MQNQGKETIKGNGGELKFRAWHKERKQMCFVDAMYQPLGGIFQKYDLQSIDTNAPIHGQAPESIKLMQYTGLKDKRGSEIFAGDILHGAKLGNTFAVDMGKCDVLQHIKDFAERDYFIAGNIYQNSELLDNK